MNNEILNNLMDEKIALLTLAGLKGVGYWALYKHLSEGKPLSPLLAFSEKAEVEHALRVKISAESENWQAYIGDAISKAKVQYEQFDKAGIRLILNGEDCFPECLSSIPDAPQWIFVQGNYELLGKNSVGIVGTRKPTEDGIFLARYAVASLARLEIPTVSGLATGIDQVVHEESLRYKIPTVAVLGTGIYSNYPAGSEGLRASIIENGGTILTEYLPHQGYSSENFIRRNRLQAALSRLLMPIEWRIKSGTAHTVAYAHKYGKKIINIYLPGSYESRPELSFSEKNYQATSYVAPNDKNLVVEVVRVVTAPKIKPLIQAALDI